MHGPLTQNLITLAILAAVMGGMMYLTVAPQRKKDREWREMMKKLRRGHRVLTRSGIYGMVTEMKDDVITVRVADKVELKMARSAIQEVVSQTGVSDLPAEGGNRSTDRKGRA